MNPNAFVPVLSSVAPVVTRVAADGAKLLVRSAASTAVSLAGVAVGAYAAGKAGEGIEAARGRLGRWRADRRNHNNDTELAAKVEAEITRRVARGELAIVPTTAGQPNGSAADRVSAPAA